MKYITNIFNYFFQSTGIGGSGAHGVNAVGHAEAVITRGHVSATIRRQLMEANSATDHSDKEIDFVMSTSVQVNYFIVRRRLNDLLLRLSLSYVFVTDTFVFRRV